MSEIILKGIQKLFQRNQNEKEVTRAKYADSQLGSPNRPLLMC